MIIKKNKKSKLIFFFVLIIILFFLLFSFTTINSKNTKIQIHSVNEWIISHDLGYSSLFNIINDGSKKFSGNYTQSISGKLISLIKNVPNIIFYKFRNIIVKNFETIYLDINFKEYQKILNDRQKALNQGHAISLDLKEVNGKIWYQGDKKKVKIKLKGTLETHWFNKRRMSLKIQLKNGETILGYNEFSIQKPRERQWPYNYAFEKLLYKFNILSTNSNFLNVIVNGEKWGVMLVEESLGKVFLENKKKKEGLIFKFGDERIWFEGWVDDPYHLYRLGDPTLIYHIYNLNKLVKKSNSDEALTNRKIISYVLEKFPEYNNNLFESSKMNKAFIFSEAWGQFHNLLNNNTSYYFNPYTLKLEPIVRDQISIDIIKNKKDILQWPPPIQFLRALEEIKSKKEFIKILDSLEKSTPLLNREFLYAKEIFPIDALKDTKILKENINLINKNKDEFLFFDTKKYYKKNENKIFLRYNQLNDLNKLKQNKLIHTKDQIKRLTDLVHIRHYSDGEIKFFNLLPHSIVIDALIYNKENILKDKLILPGYLTADQAIKIQTGIKGIQDGKFSVVSSYKGKNSLVKNKITLLKNIKNPLFKDEFLPSFIIKKDNYWKIPSGTWKIEKDLTLSGNLVIEPGTTIKFANDVSLIINGSIEAKGLPNKEIIFENLDNRWSGIYVYNSKKTSELSNVLIRGTKGVNKEILNLSGAVVFYNANVKIDNTFFSDNIAEDALNIVESEFNINNTEFLNVTSDGFDSDFSSGSITNTFFVNIGGDALDFSGSKVQIKNIKANNVKDKVISAGESSNLDVSNLEFTNIGVGVASKDGSVVNVNNCLINDTKFIAFRTYIKKKNYSSPSLIIENCVINFMKKDSKLYSNKNNDLRYFRQKGTSLKVLGIDKIIEKNLNVDLLYKTTVMNK